MAWVIDTLSGDKDGSNKVFELPHNYVPGSVHIMSPLMLQPGEFVELGGKQVELDIAPSEGDVVRALYRRDG